MFTDAAAPAAALPAPAAPVPSHATGPRTEHGKAVAARNATTHGLSARDAVLPALGEDPEDYRRLEGEWLAQLPPRTLLERHYVEKIAAASWRLRRLHRWQAQLFGDDTLTEDARLDKLDRVLRHENHLHRQIDTAVKMLGRDAPQLYARRVRDEVLEDMMTSERECRESAREETEIDLETRGRIRRIRKATQAAAGGEDRQNGPAPYLWGAAEEAEEANRSTQHADRSTQDPEDAIGGRRDADTQNCENGPAPRTDADRRAFLASFPSLDRGGSAGSGRAALALRVASAAPGRGHGTISALTTDRDSTAASAAPASSSP